MKINNKIIILAMLVMMIACVSAVSATDIESSDNVTDVIEVDEVTDIVEDAEIDDVSEDVVEEETNPVDGTINGQTWDTYVYNTTGYLKTNNDLTFSGDFYAKNFGNFKVDKSITINAADATFHNIGFDLIVSQITINGGTFIFDESAAVNAVIYDLGSENIIENTIINVTAPASTDFYAINLNQPNGAQILNNNIFYEVKHANPTNYNYVVKVLRGSKVKMIGNNITAYLPLKDVDYTNYTTRFPTIDLDFVAGVAVEQSGDFLFDNNMLNVTGTIRGGWFPTLDALIIVKSDNSNITNNRIYERDNVTGENEANYLYAVDVYQSNYMLIDKNVIELNTDGGNITVNGTGAAYGIQITGPQFITTITNNNITTANNGPNLGIYVVNSQASTASIIKNNRINVTGRAGDNKYNLVSGMELQDTYAEVSGNTIVVNNIGNCTVETCAYGISYCQNTTGPHNFYIEDNTVTVNNGNYAVYLYEEGSNGDVILNTLVANGITTKTGNDAVNAPSRVNVDDND